MNSTSEAKLASVISKKSGISSNAVLRTIYALKEEGYEIRKTGEPKLVVAEESATEAGAADKATPESAEGSSPSSV